MPSELSPYRRAFTIALFALSLAGATLPHRAEAQAKAKTPAEVNEGQDEGSADARRALVVASAQGIQITLGMLEEQINKQPPALRERYTKRAEQEKLVDELLRMELLAREARRRGFDKNPAVASTVKESAVQGLLRSEIDDKVTPAAVSADELKAFYDQHPDDFHRAAERRVSQVLLATEQEALALLPEATKADLRGFNELARKSSIDGETKLRGGDLGFFAREPKPDGAPRDIPESIRKAAFALDKPGDTSKQPVATEGGQYAIVRLTGIHPERHVELAQAESSIRSRLWRDKRQKALTELLDGLRAAQKPIVHKDRVDLIQFDDMDKRPMGFAPEHLHEQGQGDRAEPR